MKQRKELRVWWIPQVPMNPFYYPVRSVKEGVVLMDALAKYDAFQFENKIKPDYANAGGIEQRIFEDGVEISEWESWYDELWGTDNPIEYIKLTSGVEFHCKTKLIHCVTGAEFNAETKFQLLTRPNAMKSEPDIVLRVVEGGATGSESAYVTDGFIKKLEDGAWCMCAGTKGRWHEQHLVGDECKKVLEMIDAFNNWQ